MPIPTPWILTFALAAAGLGSAVPTAAHAVCFYKGELYYKTTLREEYEDARWVVRARMIEETNSWDRVKVPVSEPEEAPWTIYRIEVLETFKGDAPQTMTVFTLRDSGGFYLEPRVGEATVEEVLLYLVPTQSGPDVPSQAAGSASVNYSCGQSRPWSEVSQDDREALAVLWSGQETRP